MSSKKLPPGDEPTAGKNWSLPADVPLTLSGFSLDHYMRLRGAGGMSYYCHRPVELVQRVHDSLVVNFSLTKNPPCYDCGVRGIGEEIAFCMVCCRVVCWTCYGTRHRVDARELNTRAVYACRLFIPQGIIDKYGGKELELPNEH